MKKIRNKHKMLNDATAKNNNFILPLDLRHHVISTNTWNSMVPKRGSKKVAQWMDWM